MARTRFSELGDKCRCTPGAVEETCDASVEVLSEFRLNELRRAKTVNQADAGRLEVAHRGITRPEHADDVRCPALRR
jgi:hypothetical protein